MDHSKDIEFDGWSLNHNSGELKKADRFIRLRPSRCKCSRNCWLIPVKSLAARTSSRGSGQKVSWISIRL